MNKKCSIDPIVPEAKRFRSDLFYRLNAYPIDVPPLRDRSSDIPLLVEYFAQRFAKRAGKKIVEIESSTLHLLRAYPWPGNIRELQNVIERAVIVADTETLSVDERWLEKRTTAHRASTPVLGDELLAHERARVEAALNESNGRVGTRGRGGQARHAALDARVQDSNPVAARTHRDKVAWRAKEHFMAEPVPGIDFAEVPV